MGTIVTIPRPPGDQRSPETLNEAFSRGFSLPSSETTELILVRHAEPDYPAARISEDPWDPPLSERGRAQAMRLARRLKSLEVDAVYASTMRRAFETAAIVAAAQDLPVTHVYELREIGFDPAALTHALRPDDRAADLAARFLASPHWDTPPGFEPSEEFRRRVAEATKAIAERHPGQRVVVVSHGGVINAYLSLRLGIQRDMFFMPEHTSISVMRVLEDLSALHSLNDHAHLLFPKDRQP
jgi:probable phosphoglycerate mutase